jgi:hypothetical protein
MRKLSSMILVGTAIVLAAASPSYAAAGHRGHGFSGHSAGGHFEGHHGFEGRHGFDRRHDFERRGHGRVFLGASFYFAPYYYPSAYTYSPTPSTYWYYCPSYGAYYPTVPSCPEAWVPVPG